MKEHSNAKSRSLLPTSGVNGFSSLHKNPGLNSSLNRPVKAVPGEHGIYPGPICLLPASDSQPGGEVVHQGLTHMNRDRCQEGHCWRFTLHITLERRHCKSLQPNICRVASWVRRINDYNFFSPHYRLIIDFLILYRLILSTFLFSGYLALI